jgi:hypothetical protein
MKLPSLPFEIPLDLRVAIPLALLAGLSLALVFLSFMTLARARAMVRRATQEVESARGQWEELFESCRKDLASHREDLDRQAADLALHTSARQGINLSRRSQALRMYRKGEAPERIAEALQIPRQEVELLVKVHEIVLTNI